MNPDDTNTHTHESDTEKPAPENPEQITRIADLQRMNIDELSHYARHIGLKNLGALTRSQLVFEVVKAKSERPGEVLVGEGVLEILPDSFGFLRSPNYNYLPSAEDIYVSPAQIRRFDLRKGDTVYGTIRSPKDKEKYFALLKVEKINNQIPEKAHERILFENLTPLYPNQADGDGNNQRQTDNARTRPYSPYRQRAARVDCCSAAYGKNNHSAKYRKLYCHK